MGQGQRGSGGGGLMKEGPFINFPALLVSLLHIKGKFEFKLHRQKKNLSLLPKAEQFDGAGGGGGPSPPPPPIAVLLVLLYGIK